MNEAILALRHAKNRWVLTPKVPKLELDPWLFCIDLEGGTCAPFAAPAGWAAVADAASDVIVLALMTVENVLSKKQRARTEPLAGDSTFEPSVGAPGSDFEVFRTVVGGVPVDYHKRRDLLADQAWPFGTQARKRCDNIDFCDLDEHALQCICFGCKSAQLTLSSWLFSPTLAPFNETCAVN